jgi:hypothetical protein
VTAKYSGTLAASRMFEVEAAGRRACREKAIDEKSADVQRSYSVPLYLEVKVSDTRERLLAEFDAFFPELMKAINNRHRSWQQFRSALRRRDSLVARLDAVLAAGG